MTQTLIKNFREFSWNSVYRAGDQNLFKEFYQPALSVSVSYDRAVGFFSSQSLVSNLQGITGLVQNDGKMRLIIGHPLDDAEFTAVKHGYRMNELLSDLDHKLNEMLESSSQLVQLNLSILSLLIATNRLEIKFAFRKRGMYHEKIGVMTDIDGNKLVFQGSANETIFALEEGYNAESIMVFKSWQQEVFDSYGVPCIEGFEKLWNGEQQNTVTVTVPSKFYETIVEKAKADKTFTDLSDLEGTFSDQTFDALFSTESAYNIPHIPTMLNGNGFKIKEHQKRAIQAWISNSYKGILKLSTGSGKTITAIYAATRVYEARKAKNVPTVLIISVPYQELAKQWVENLSVFNIHPLKCWMSKASWVEDLKKELLDLRMKALDFIAIVVVNRTMESTAFQEIITEIPNDQLMFVGDECHNHGALTTNKALPDAFYRMGLSATPYRSDNDEIDSPFPNDARDRINSYYHNIVAEYSLGDAIHDGVLCDYNYFPVPVYLTAEEEEEYEDLSREIGKLLVSGGRSLSNAQKSQLTMLCGRRSRLLGAASQKIPALKTIVESIPSSERKHALFYCGEGAAIRSSDEADNDLRVIDNVSMALSESGWKTTRFTSQESSKDRVNIMRNFVEAHIDGLVSMKVLDEGVDVPVCDKAFILASTRNPRQYVQRRGRVLRRADGKTHADIYDFIILPRQSSPSLDALKKAELERIDDFVLLASNRYEVEKEVNELGLRG